MWERGLKETLTQGQVPLYQSLPVWERGLKDPKKNLTTSPEALKSLPVWERGLKDPDIEAPFEIQFIAPRVGAWIERLPRAASGPIITIAPRVGAWIERGAPPRVRLRQPIAPRVGAWIESRNHPS